MTCSVSVIIPQFGNLHLTDRLLNDLSRHETFPSEIIVVDDGTPRHKGHFFTTRPPARLIQQSHRGVTAAWNSGAKLARGEVLLFLNNDARVEAPFLECVVRSVRETSEPKIVGVRQRIERAIPACCSPGKPRELIEGWCLAMPRYVFRLLDGFDENFTLYFSDTDFQWRFLEKYPHGTLRCLDLLQLRHAGHQTTRLQSDRNKLWLNDRATFLKKWINQ